MKENPKPELFQPSAEQMHAAVQRIYSKKTNPSSYTITQSHVDRNNDGTINEIAVLWKDGDAFRATFVNTKLSVGYLTIKGNEDVTKELLQSIAGYGLYLDEKQKKKYFPDVKNWSK